MSQKLTRFKYQVFAEKIHFYLKGLPNVIVDDSSKRVLIGYYVEGQRYKFATLVVESKNVLILHVNPGEKNTMLGKEIQLKVQELLDFDIRDIRNHEIKANEVYIPLDKLYYSHSVESIGEFIDLAYHKQDK